jgi:hypothetical protein
VAKVKNLPAVYRGFQINFDGEMVSLTDMWKANGSNPSKRVPKWMELPSTTQFIDTLEKKSEVRKSDLIYTVKGNFKDGRVQGTWAHWQIALAYAKYLSPEFHIWCNEVAIVQTSDYSRFFSAGDQNTGPLDSLYRSGGAFIRRSFMIMRFLSDHPKPARPFKQQKSYSTDPS